MPGRIGAGLAWILFPLGLLVLPGALVLGIPAACAVCLLVGSFSFLVVQPIALLYLLARWLVFAGSVDHER